MRLRACARAIAASILGAPEEHPQPHAQPPYATNGSSISSIEQGVQQRWVQGVGAGLAKVSQGAPAASGDPPPGLSSQVRGWSGGGCKRADGALRWGAGGGVRKRAHAQIPAQSWLARPGSGFSQLSALQ